MKNSGNFFNAFVNAGKGMKHFFLLERNGKVQSVVGLVAIVASIVLHIAAMEWVAVLLCIGGVLSLEMLNSALEKLCDLVDEEYNPAIKIIKDVSAGAVLWASMISVVIGGIIFLPKLVVFL